MSTPTLTAAELLALHDSLMDLRRELTLSPEWCEPTPLGVLAEMDDDALAAAAKVVHRLYLDRRFAPRSRRATSYLPEPTPEPQSLRA